MLKQKLLVGADEFTFGILDIVQFINSSYKKIALVALGGLACAVMLTITLGQYTASIMLTNYAELDALQIRYLQSTLPKLAQEDPINGSKNYLASERLWQSAIKLNTLIGQEGSKAVKDLASIKPKIYQDFSIEVIGKANDISLAKERAQEIKSFFINGAALIDLRDLFGRYRRSFALANLDLEGKILAAEVELTYIERRIKNLNEIRRQFPVTIADKNNSLQLINRGDASKYYPILTQIIAAISDQDEQIELLRSYREELAKMRIYKLFLEKGEPLLDEGIKDPKLLVNLLDIVNELKQESNKTYEKVALSTIENDINKIVSFRIYGLLQVGTIRIEDPTYVKNIAIGLFGGAILGILFALGLALTRHIRNEMKLAG